ncbi:MAG: SIS domain-containing protein [Candidatus Anstonellaceae archaeon]
MVELKKTKNELIEALSSIEEDEVINCANIIKKAFLNGNKVLIAGNGGSAADAQHFATELVCTFLKINRPALPAIALTTNTSILTAWSNDFSFDGVFQRQLIALGRKGDIYFSISTSGNSPNIIKSMETAKELSLINILLTGQDGGKAKEFADFIIHVKSKNVQRIQECHIFILHQICSIIEEDLNVK